MEQHSITDGKAAQELNMNLPSSMHGTSVTTTERLHPVSPGKMLVMLVQRLTSTGNHHILSRVGTVRADLQQCSLRQCV